ncbi:PAS domain S-box protein [archaeon]|nr:PAS domain S-box protein [archaeon]
MLSAVPLMMAFGYVLDKKLKLERELKEYTDQLEQSAWSTSAELVASEEKFSKVFFSSHSLIIITDLSDGKIIDVNNSVVKISGYSREELIGKTTMGLGLWANPNERDKYIKAIQKDGNVTDLETDVRAKSGKRYTLLLSGEIVNIGEVQHLISIGNDITERKEAEVALHESEEKYSTLIERGNDGIIIIQDGLLKFVNSKMVEMSGYLVEEVLEKPFIEFISPDLREEVMFIYKKRMAGEDVPDRYETEILRKDGATVPIEVNASSIEYGGKPASMAMLRDITERKKAENEIKRNYHIQNVINKILHVSLEQVPLTQQLERVLDLMLSIPWLVLEKKGCIFLVEDDPKVLVLKAQRGLHEALLTKCENVPFGHCICGRAAATKEILFVDSVDERHDNTYDGIKPHGHYCVPILSGAHVLGVLNLYVKEGHEWNTYEAEFLSAVADAIAGIIERRHSMEELEEAHEKLEESHSKMEETHEALQNAYEDLKDVDRLKDDIISNVSHELRTPITIIKGALEMSRDEEDIEMRDKLYRVAISALAKQNRIVGNLVEMAAFRKKKFAFNFEEVKLGHLVSLVMGEVKREAELKEIKIESDVPDIAVMVDFEGLKLVLLNLLDNAVKFSDPGGHIAVKAEVKGDKAHVCIEDEGIGVPEEFRDKIFDKLFQLDATTTRRFAGTGMGLAVAKEIIEAHGGNIWVEGRKKGSLFCFTVPLSKGE